MLLISAISACATSFHAASFASDARACARPASTLSLVSVRPAKADDSALEPAADAAAPDDAPFQSATLTMGEEGSGDSIGSALRCLPPEGAPSAEAAAAPA